MKLKPTGNLVLVKPILPQYQTSPIDRPDAFQEERVQAVVYETGAGRMTQKGLRIKPEIQKGQIVYIGSNPLNAQEIKIGNELFLMCPETSLLAVVGINPEWESAPYISSLEDGPEPFAKINESQS